MSVVENKKAKNALENLLDRQTYLVTQANELARAFGNLTVKQYRTIIFCRKGGNNVRLVKKSQIPDFEVYVDGKKDEELTVKAKKALEFIDRYDKVAGNQLSILDWDSKLQDYYFDNSEKLMKDRFFDKK